MYNAMQARRASSNSSKGGGVGEEIYVKSLGFVQFHFFCSPFEYRLKSFTFFLLGNTCRDKYRELV